MNADYQFCPRCAAALQTESLGGYERRVCPSDGCGFIFWGNPTPVVAAVVEHEGKLLLARNVAWPAGTYALITGFLERHEIPAEAAQREVVEELNLKPLGAHFIGHYTFERMNQLIIAFHVPAEGEVTLNEELAEWKHVSFDEATYWPAATGLALRDWLQSQGYQPTELQLPFRNKR
ncbi:NUDIX domain-containing protein [Solimonas marina]|uniref:NUDIX domain-containing protein n=1 Tax=Solimonas marina TaxID=2714601 RepID=A0A970B891_9GAMM|nr:NUDIX domain-containing protein [Solimonas marina]NKF21141.1 NUDIX domain-containing protein [Solimonas marina]